MHIQRYRHAPEHTHVHIRVLMPMYLEVWSIMALNLDVPDPNKQEQPPGVVTDVGFIGGRSWWFSGFL